MIEFNVKLELKDYTRLNIYHSKKNIIFSLLLGWIIVTIFSINYTLSFKIFGYIFFTVFYLVLYILRLKRISKKIYNSDKFMQDEIHYKINENEIIQETKSSNFKMSINDVVKVGEDKYSIYIYISKIKVILIPKRCISSDEQEKLKAILKV